LCARAATPVRQTDGRVANHGQANNGNACSERASKRNAPTALRDGDDDASDHHPGLRAADHDERAQREAMPPRARRRERWLTCKRASDEFFNCVSRVTVAGLATTAGGGGSRVLLDQVEWSG